MCNYCTAPFCMGLIIVIFINAWKYFLFLKGQQKNKIDFAKYNNGI